MCIRDSSSDRATNDHISPSKKSSGRKSPSSTDSTVLKAQDDDTSQMNLVEFVSACVRLSYHRYRDPSLTERVHKFVKLLAENPCFSAVEDEVCQRMAASEELAAIFTAHEDELKGAFAAAAALNNEKEKKEGGNKTNKRKMSKRGAQARGKKASKAVASEPPTQQDTIDLDEWITFLNMSVISFTLFIPCLVISEKLFL